MYKRQISAYFARWTGTNTPWITLDPQPQTIADGVATTSIGRYTFPIMRRLLEGIVTVPEEDILRALELILTRSKQVVEPTGALSTAAALFGHAEVRGKRVMSLLCGGNLDLRVLERLRG